MDPAQATAYAPETAQAAQPARDAAATVLLRRIIEVKGGLDALRKVRSVVADADTSLQMEQGTLSSTTRTYVVYPDKFRVDAKVAGADVVQVYNSGAAWIRDPNGVHDAPQPMRDDFSSSVRRDTIPMLIAAADGMLAVTLLPEEGRDGGVLRVLEISGESFAPVRLFIDAQGLIARQSFTTPGIAGRATQVEEIYSDYRKADGVLVPYRAELVRNGRPVLTRTLRSVTLNSPVDARLFERPAS